MTPSPRARAVSGSPNGTMVARYSVPPAACKSSKSGKRRRWFASSSRICMLRAPDWSIQFDGLCCHLRSASDPNSNWSISTPKVLVQVRATARTRGWRVRILRWARANGKPAATICSQMLAKPERGSKSPSAAFTMSSQRVSTRRLRSSLAMVEFIGRGVLKLFVPAPGGVRAPPRNVPRT